MIGNVIELREDSVRMKDLQRDRLKHLLANAIMELWKKETGSMSAVLIEATICITSGNGKTTVLQVADKFGGSIPEVEDDNNNVLRQPVYPDPFLRFNIISSPPHISSRYYQPPKVDISHIPSNGNYIEDMSPRSMMSPRIDRSRERGDSSPRLMKMDSRDQPMDTSSTSKEDESDSASETSRCEPSTPGDKGYQGLYTAPSYHSTPSQPSHSIGISALNLSSTSEQSHTEEDEGSPPKRLREDSSDERDSDNNRRAVDLRRSESDLFLSPPSSYTAQVRDVIRQRLLASKGNQEQQANSGPPIKEERGLDRQDSGRGRSPSPVRDLNQSSPSGNYNYLPPTSMALINGQFLHRSLSGTVIPAPVPLVGQPPLSMLEPGLHHPILKLKTDMQALCSPSPSPGSDVLSPNFYPGQLSLNCLPPLDLSSDGSPGEKDANGEQRVYKCMYCVKTFLFKSKYHEHMPVHTNIRPFQCHLCSRTYKYKYDLRVHLRTHMGIPTKSTVCPFCNIKFETNKLLRLHIKESHRDKQKLSEEECTNNSEHLPPAL